MNAKLRSVSPVRVLAEAGIATHGVPLIRDGLYAHHRDLGGALYLYFDDPGKAREAQAILERTPGIDEVVPNAEARARPPAARARGRPDLLGGPGRRPRRLDGRARAPCRDGAALARLQARAAHPDAGGGAGRAGRAPRSGPAGPSTSCRRSAA